MEGPCRTEERQGRRQSRVSTELPVTCVLAARCALQTVGVQTAFPTAVSNPGALPAHHPRAPVARDDGAARPSSRSVAMIPRSHAVSRATRFGELPPLQPCLKPAPRLPTGSCRGSPPHTFDFNFSTPWCKGKATLGRIDVSVEEEEEEEDLFVFNDTIEGPRAPAVKPGRVTQA